MRNMIRTIVVGMAFLSLAALASGYVPSNVAWLKANNDSPLNPTTWPGAGKWQIDGASAPLDTEIVATQDYGVKNKVQFRLKIGTTTFAGKSLTVGALDRSSTGSVIFRTTDGCDTTFDNEGLFLYAGSMQSWNSGTQIVRGKVTVRSPDTDPMAIAFTTKGGELVFRCPVESDTGMGLYLHSLAQSSSSMNQTNFVCRFLDNALSAYNGSIMCSPVYFDGRSNVSYYTKTNYNNSLKPPYHVTFQTDSGTMPGSLTLYPNAIIAGETSATDFSVGSLSSVSLNGYGTNFLSVALAADGSACSLLRVTGSIDLQSPMAVRLSPDTALDYFMATNAAAAMRLPILKAPANVALDPAKFFMERNDAFPYLPNYELEVADDSADSLSTLWLVRRPVAWTLAADSSSNSSFTRANWSDGGTAGQEKDYLALHNVRTIAIDSTAVQEFPGHSLTIADEAKYLTLNSSATRINDLRVFGCIIDNLNRGRAEYNFMAGAIKSWKLEGRIRLARDGTLYLRCYPSNGFRVDSELSGGGAIEIHNQSQSGNNNPLRAYVGLFGINTNFHGTVLVKNKATTTPAARVSPNLAIRDARNLGGPLSNWTYNALTLQNCCGLHPLETLTLDDETRGIYLSGTYAFFTVTNDVVFTCKERITYSGTLIKDGTGELALGGPEPHFNAAGTAAPTANKNVLDVWEGTLRPVSATAFQGLAVVITNAAATLAMDVPVSNEDGDIGQYGMLNTTWNAPLTVPAGGLAVQLCDTNGVLASKKLCRVPVCTVNATAKAALEGKLSVGRSPSRRHVVTSAGWTENTDGTFTFAATIERTGFMVNFR
ncbi:MAG: hypothetical protein IKO72_08860 [Kiritimatiellae bacterium]|nr:hypothetical protein [Kiritimatiellia bacterium]